MRQQYGSSRGFPKRNGLAILILIASSMMSCAFTTIPGAVRRSGIQSLPLRVSSRETNPPVNGGADGWTNGEKPGSPSPKEQEEQDKKTTPRQHRFTKIPRKAIQIYSEYASRLWKETNTDARTRIANDKVTQSVKHIQHLFRGDAYCDLSSVSSQNRQNLLEACDSILNENETARNKSEEQPSTPEEQAPVPATTADAPKGKKKERSVLFGAAMGAVVACWVFSGNYIFTGLFTLMTILGQLEYYRMVMNTGTNANLALSR